MFIVKRCSFRRLDSVPRCDVKLTVDYYNRQGREFRCKVKPTLLRGKCLKAYVLAPLVRLRGCVASQIDNGFVRSYFEPRFSSIAGIMTWACPRCTFLNQGKIAVCNICSYDNPQPVEDAGPEWSCPSCTYLNLFVESACDMCNTARPELDELERKDIGENGPRPTSKFRPLRSNQRGKADKEQLSEATDSNAATPIITDLHSFLKPSDMLSRKRKAVDDEDGSKVSDMEGCTTSRDRNATGDGELSNNLLGELHMERMARLNNLMKSSQQTSAEASGMASDSQMRRGSEKSAPPSSTNNTDTIVILSYNVWFREDLELHGRMNAIGNIILQHQPHVICFQEVTTNIYSIFQRSSWWKLYQCSVPPAQSSKRAYFCMQMIRLPVLNFHRNPFNNSVMGRELCMADMDDGHGEQLVVATSHLESPCPAPPTWNQMFSKERVAQANEALNFMKDMPNVVFGGDMNWDDKTDGAPPLPKGWFDPWLKLHPTQPGLTYDSKANLMLTGSRLQKRIDRFFCHLQNFKVDSLEMVGTQPIPGLTYQKERKVKREVQMQTLPVYPSDHFGLLLKLQRLQP
ncbi:tyrosyl-DNA phosphodiesterase 2 [Marchantia polymorpha subsp. ruderalis]|uniref:RanBP2-type domain-containing protein n=1 Tax=Marchantia polymorpha TaxID=3197 RepID=A0A2R6X9H6_MARPO|nr:hypothetical protein MARPO_0028s0073 [Marchantia polymorpha]BBN00638.1 hypothetical protein Mp_2g00780 [Marchantia polymorpha subsp. ruderalis]|eukprot:PTQ42758.1 hypothetical protein MARPO_0028s0073 [Marchantia polymorpha]